jgi:putative transposase
MATIVAIDTSGRRGFRTHALGLQLRQVLSMMLVCVHASAQRWALKILPMLVKAFRRCKRPVGSSWRMGEA